MKNFSDGLNPNLGKTDVDRRHLKVLREALNELSRQVIRTSSVAGGSRSTPRLGVSTEAPLQEDRLVIIDQVDNTKKARFDTENLLSSPQPTVFFFPRPVGTVAGYSGTLAIYEDNGQAFENLLSLGPITVATAPGFFDIQEAIDYRAAQGGGVVYIPEGTWNNTTVPTFTGIVIPAKVHVYGSGTNSTTLECTDANTHLIHIVGGHCGVHDLTAHGPNTTGSGIGIFIDPSTVAGNIIRQVQCSDVTIDRSCNWGMYLGSDDLGAHIVITSIFKRLVITNNKTTSVGSCFTGYGNTSNTWVECEFQGQNTTGTYNDGGSSAPMGAFHIHGATSQRIQEAVFELGLCSLVAISMERFYHGTVIENCYFERAAEVLPGDAHPHLITTTAAGSASNPSAGTVLITNPQIFDHHTLNGVKFLRTYGPAPVRNITVVGGEWGSNTAGVGSDQSVVLGHVEDRLCLHHCGPIVNQNVASIVDVGVKFLDGSGAAIGGTAGADMLYFQRSHDSKRSRGAQLTTTARDGLTNKTVGDTVFNKQTLQTEVYDGAKWLPGRTGQYVTTSAASYSALVSDENIVVDASGGAKTVTLPTAVGVTGKRYNIKKADSSNNTVTVATTSSQTIDGSTTQVFDVQNVSLSVVSNGSNWEIV